MKARIIRYVFATHRWMGVTLGWLMLLWCVSGVVMIWWPQPSMKMDGRDYRVEGLAPISLPAEIRLPPIPDDAVLSAARIEMLVDRPVIALAWEGDQGGRGLFDLTTGEKIDSVGEAEALAIAGAYAAQHKLKADPKIVRLMERDEFTVSGEFNSRRPLYEIALNDPDATVLYVSSKTGAVAQRTTGALRVASWLGWIPHWLYFTELRKDGKLWTDVIVWTSLAGTFLTVIGLFVGFRQFRRRHSTGKHASPYHGGKFFHHMLGLVFGVLVLTFVFSGFASMNPWGWLNSGPQVDEPIGRYMGKPVAWPDARPALDAQVAELRAHPGATKLVSYTSLMDKPYFMWTAADGSEQRLDADARPAPFTEADRAEAAKRLGGGGVAQADVLTAPDAYYYPGASGFPAIRVTVPAIDTAFYLDGRTGDVVNVADPGTRGFRWWHSALHTFDVFPPVVREIVIFLAMLGVTGVCGFGFYIGIRKLMRGGRLDNTPKDEEA